MLLLRNFFAGGFEPESRFTAPTDPKSAVIFSLFPASALVSEEGMCDIDLRERGRFRVAVVC